MATTTKTREKFNLDQVITDKLIAAIDEGTAPWKSPYLVRGLAMSMATNKPYRGINPLLLAFESADKGYTSRWWGTYDQIAERAGMVKAQNGRRSYWRAPEDVAAEEAGLRQITLTIEGTEDTEDGEAVATVRKRYWDCTEDEARQVGLIRDDEGHFVAPRRGIRKGERSTMVVFWKRMERKPNDEEIAAGADPEKAKKFFLQRYFFVFNAEQADWPDGMPEKFADSARDSEFTPLDEAEAIVLGYTANGGPSVVHKDQSMAWYAPAHDLVNVPSPQNIDGDDAYYSTLFHELTHSTGAASRLNRDGIAKLTAHRRGELYAFEELVAEFGAAMLCARAGISDTVDNSAAYLSHWASFLRNDPTAAIKAASQAQKAVDLICGTTFDDESKEG